MFVKAKCRHGQGVQAVEELERTVAMSTVTPSADDEPVQMFVFPVHGELHHMMQLRSNLLGESGVAARPGLTPRRLIRNWRMDVTSEESESIASL
ncbi:hypothetical protein SAMN06266956_0582 [Paraburkholderia hospita]|nr:hypothetical protein SAMN06266956_0582 [Paraburkholderia hospita]